MHFLHALDEITTTIWAWQMMNEHMDDICDAMKRHFVYYILRPMIATALGFDQSRNLSFLLTSNASHSDQLLRILGSRSERCRLCSTVEYRVLRSPRYCETSVRRARGS